jgi:hypothetical protein
MERDRASLIFSTAVMLVPFMAPTQTQAMHLTLLPSSCHHVSLSLAVIATSSPRLHPARGTEPGCQDEGADPKRIQLKQCSNPLYSYKYVHHWLPFLSF